MIAIIYINDLNECPFVDKYFEILNQFKINYDVIMWEKEKELVKKKNYNDAFIYHKYQKNSANKIIKLIDYWKYGKFVTCVLKKNKYEKLIVLTTFSGIVSYKFLKKYKNKYIFDYRDMSYEYLPFFKRIVMKMINNSAFCPISSRGFIKKISPSSKYIIAHNFNKEVYKKYIDCPFRKNEKNRIVVLYIGAGRGDEYNKLLIDIFANDPRFILKIIGANNDSEFIKNYIENIGNVFVQGYYSNEQKYLFIENSDIICYNYVSNFINDYALANKFYDGLIYKKPLLGNIETYSGKLIEEKKVGISLNFDDPMYLDKLYSYYINLNIDEYNYNVKESLKEIIIEDEIFDKKIIEFIKE